MKIQLAPIEMVPRSCFNCEKVLHGMGGMFCGLDNLEIWDPNDALVCDDFDPVPVTLAARPRMT